MENLLEQRRAPEPVAEWHEIESAFLLGLPERRHLELVGLDSLAALPFGSALRADITVARDGDVQVVLRQLNDSRGGNVPLPWLALIAPAVAPGVRLAMGMATDCGRGDRTIMPGWSRPVVSGDARSVRDCDDSTGEELPLPASSWPWDIRRALASIAAAGGGTLILLARNLERSAQLRRRIRSMQDKLVAAAYASPDNGRLINSQAGCRAMIEDPAVFGFSVQLSRCDAGGPLPDLVALALFGTLDAGTPDFVAEDVDLRLVSGSRHGPGSLVPSFEDAASLATTLAHRPPASGPRLVLGETGNGVAVALTENDRARHLYVIGATGTGKSTLLKTLIAQDVAAGDAVIVLDPHGDLAEDVAAAMPPSRTEDLVYADASDAEGRFAVGLLPTTPDSAAFEIAADTLVSLFRQNLWSGVQEAFGPMFESYFRNALALLLAAETEERCLANLPKVFEDRDFRKALLDACGDEGVVNFWRKTALRAGGAAELTNITPYITSKLTRFIATEHSRAMFPAAGCCLDFASAMNNGRILVLRCPKGALGEGLSELAMSACLMKIRETAMARAATRERRPVRVYIDEFQACRGMSLQTLLAEGRKFGISLVLANQSLGQIGGTTNHSIGGATLANVGNLVAFRLGAVDAMQLAPWLDMPDRWRDPCWLPDFTMHARVLEQGRLASYPRVALAASVTDQPEMAAGGTA